MERGGKGKKRGTSVHRHRAAEIFIYICLCLPGDVHHVLGGDLKAPSKSAPHITLFVFLLHMISEAKAHEEQGWEVTDSNHWKVNSNGKPGSDAAP